MPWTGGVTSSRMAPDEASARRPAWLTARTVTKNAFRCAPNSATFYLRQVVSSANFRTGSDTNDFMHGWLNYQVEHHLWPSLSALSYQKAQPQVAEICEKYGVPYIQENVFLRLKKTVDIMVGKADQRTYPSAYENDKDAMTWTDQKEVAKLGMGAGGSTISADRTSEDVAVAAA